MKARWIDSCQWSKKSWFVTPSKEEYELKSMLRKDELGSARVLEGYNPIKQ
jgi:hypothetical protein